MQCPSLDPSRLAKIVLFTLIVILATASTQAEVWDLDTDFSATENPVGAWSYCYSLGLGQPAILFPDPGEIAPGVNGWWDLASYPNYTPGMEHNVTDDDITLGGDVIIPAHSSALHPELTSGGRLFTCISLPPTTYTR